MMVMINIYLSHHSHRFRLKKKNQQFLLHAKHQRQKKQTLTKINDKTRYDVTFLFYRFNSVQTQNWILTFSISIRI